MWDRLSTIDRRWVFLAIGLAVSLPFFFGATVPVGTPGPRAKDLYQAIEDIPSGGVIMLSFNYGPAAMPELDPMAMAITRHALGRGVRVIAQTLDPEGTLMADRVFRDIADKMPDKRDSVDYVNLGYKPGGVAVVLGIAEGITKTYSTDARGRTTRSLEVLDGVEDYDDIALVVDLASSGSYATWVLYAHERSGQRVAAGVTAVMATDIYPYLDTGQLVGALKGMKGAAAYEELIGVRGTGYQGMTSQSVAHLVIILFVIVGNIGYFATRRRRSVG